MTTLSFVGREAERQTIRERMNLNQAWLTQPGLTQPDCRLLTITGAGGVGKTRLVSEVGREIRETGVRVVLVSLAEVLATAQVFPAVATALDLITLTGESSDVREQVYAALSHSPTLLILDNYEQLLPDVSPIRDLIDAVPGLRLIVTSRERLNLRDEWVMRLDGLPLKYDAANLFAQRAKQIAPEFEPEREAKHIAEICEAVEGLPLAIELAAAWLTVMPCSAISSEIAHSLSRMRTPHRDAEPRHASLEAVFEGTWTTLTQEQAERFARLSIFRGGFSRLAAEAVAGATLDDLRSYVDKSLFRHEGRMRYHLHELLRQFADSHLADDERAELRTRHSTYMLETLRNAEGALKSAEQTAALDSLEADFANIEDAWTHAIESGMLSQAAEAADSLRLLAIMRSRLVDVARLYETALILTPDVQTLHDGTPFLTSVGSAQTAIRKIRLRRLFLRDWETGIDPGAGDEVERCYLAASQAGDLTEAAFARRVQGHMAFAQKDYAAARQNWSEALALYAGELSGAGSRPTTPAAKVEHERMELLRLIGHTYLFDNQSAQALPYYRQSLSLAEAIGDRVGAAGAWMGIGGSLRDTGDGDGAYQAHYAAHRLQRETGNWGRYAWNLTNLAEVAYERGDVYTAAEHLAQATEAAARTEGRTPSHFREWLQDVIGAKLKEYETIKDSLTGREIEVLKLIEAGLSNGEIAERLVVVPGTVKLHVHSILKKLSAENRAHAVALARVMRVIYE